jgi:hypothetical protein
MIKMLPLLPAAVVVVASCTAAAAAFVDAVRSVVFADLDDGLDYCCWRKKKIRKKMGNRPSTRDADYQNQEAFTMVHFAAAACFLFGGIVNYYGIIFTKKKRL